MPDFEKFDDLKRDDMSLRTAGPSANESAAAPNPSSSEKLIGETIDGRYQLMEMIGEGGMGRVYKAKQIMTGRTVALKMLPTRNTSDMTHMMRFQQEAKAACAVNHPNAVSVYEFGITPDGIPYIAMQFVEGVTLADEIARSKSISELFALQIFEQMANALDCAHEQRVLHRDIKPSNIMLVPDKRLGRKAMLLDFGIAKLEDETQVQLNITKTGDVFGTPFYMSPEQCQGQKLDNRADIYSLGCVIYEALTGTPPFTGDNFLQIVYRHVHDPALPIANFPTRKPVSEALQDIVRKCLEKDPANRFQSMAQLRSALENANKRPVTLQKSGADKKMMAAVLILISIVMLAVVGVFTYLRFKPVAQVQNMPAPAESKTRTPEDWHEVYSQAMAALDEGRWPAAQKLLDTAYGMTATNTISRASLTVQLADDGERHRKFLLTLRQQGQQLYRPDQPRSPELTGLRFQCLKEGKLAEILIKETLHCLPGSQREAIEEQRFRLAQLYADLVGIWDTPLDDEMNLRGQAEAIYEQLENPSNPYVLHQYGTFLVQKGTDLKKLSLSSDLPSDEAEKVRQQYKACIAKAIMLLNNCADRCIKLVKAGEDRHHNQQLAADSHFWIGVAYNVADEYKKADEEYNKAARSWISDKLSRVYDNQAYNLECWAVEARRMSDYKEADSLSARAVKLREKAKKTK